ncbi:glycosyltransferase [Opitutales bacterium]|nr:glycosyltransferase [Opitutales bacterium]
MNEDDNIFISVVIPTYERPNDLKICLNSLSKEIQQGAPTYEIIVSDDSKSEESKRMVESDFPNVFWGKGKQNGPAGNRNAGVSRARGKWIVFLDDDCIAQEGYLDAYAKVIQTNSNIQVFEGRIFADRKRRTWAEGCPENEHGGMLWTSNLCVNKSLFFEIGKFDERFKVAYEDVEFAHRLKQRKIKTFFVFDAAVCHPWRSLRSGGKNWKSKGYQIESLLLFLGKHSDAHEEHGKPVTYFKNFIRIVTKNLIYCLLNLKGNGVDILLSEACISLKTSFLLLIAPKKN